MVRRVTLALIAGLCALFAGCGKQGEPQQDAAVQEPGWAHGLGCKGGLAMAPPLGRW